MCRSCCASCGCRGALLLASLAQAAAFHAKFGYNSVETKQVWCLYDVCARACTIAQTPWYVDVLWRYLDWVSLVILAAAIISAAVPNDGSRGWTSFTLLIIELNLIVWVGYFTDRNAGNAIKELEVRACDDHWPMCYHTLQALSAPRCICKRDGQWGELDVKELCVGDVVQLKGGDVIPADAKVR